MGKDSVRSWSAQIDLGKCRHRSCVGGRLCGTQRQVHVMRSVDSLVSIDTVNNKRLFDPDPLVIAWVVLCRGRRGVAIV